MADPIWFVISGVSRRIYVPAWAQQTLPAPPIDRAALVIPARSSQPEVLSAEAAWSIPGAVVVFAPSTLITAARLPGGLDAFLAGATRGATAAIWLENPADPPALWRATVLPVTARTGISGEVAGLATIPLRNFALRIPGASRLTVLAEGRWRIDPGPAGPMAFTGRYGAVSSPIDGPLTIALGPDRPGVVEFGWRLTPELERAFDIGLHYFAEEPTQPASGLLRGPRLALTPTPEAGYRMAAAIDPLAPTDPSRTALRFSPPPAAFDSTLRDQVGRPLQLLAHDDFRLAFMGAPATLSPQAEEPLCLTPVGGAALGPAEALVPGLSSSELVTLDATAALHLEPGGAALAVALGSNGSNAALANRATTSWVRVSNRTASRPQYLSQPTGAGLHTVPPSGDFGAFLPLPVAYVDAETPVPIAPWGGADPLDVGFDKSVETTGVAPTRRAILGGGARPPTGLERTAGRHPPGVGGPAAAGDDDTTAAITPQGLVASVAPNGDLASLRLAKLDATALTMTSVTGPLLDALMTDKQFIVVSDPRTASRYLTSSTLTVDQWTFSLDGATWAKHGTMLLIKNCPRAISELAFEPAAWAQATKLNSMVDVSSRKLSAFISETLGRPGHKTAYAPIKQALTDPGWNGILFINAAAPLNALPDALGGLAAGIDADRFFAHHLRIDRTPVQTTSVRGPNAEDTDNSSVFALIDYRAAAPLHSVEPYAYQVDTLQVLIESSKVSAFQSQVTLVANQLFGARVTSENRYLQFNGRYQQQEDTYFLALAPQGQPTLVVDDATVKTFAITGGTYVTVHDPSTKEPATTPQGHSRFNLDGALELADVSGDGSFDLFGFDVLPVTGIAVDIRYDPKQPQFAKLSFDPSGAQIDVSDSVVRAGSLPKNFPILPRTFVSAGTGNNPTQLAAMPVSVPPAWSGPSAPWYALAFDLDLGTAGALAGRAAMVARLYLQWSPSVDAGRWAVRLGLPGATGGGTSISLMGVLKLNIFAISLQTLSSGAFQLTLEGIAMTVMSRSIPPGGTLTLALLGDPSGAKPPPLSWYGAYLASKGSAVSASPLTAGTVPLLEHPTTRTA